ncbi:MAG TPA: RNA-binding protein [Rhodospirillaceae bacterium]|nr:MAG: hypothetical protein A2018_07215 [Alphaproteobacteria bacterium GWF2_58_20]HAU29264.1 RNA-binding protein [Rhodospirillaceae bacterium]
MAQNTAKDETAFLEEPEFSGPLRRCIATGEILPRERLLRFAIAPDGTLVPDLAAKLPGRGFWLLPSPENIALAVKKGRFSQAARRTLSIPDGFCETIATLLAKRCLAQLGIARRGGQLVSGFDKTEAWLKSHKGSLLLEASDGSMDGRMHMRHLASNAPVIGLFTSAEMAEALGKSSAVVHAAMPRGRSSAAFLAECRRLAPFRSQSTFLVPTDHTPQVS